MIGLTTDIGNGYSYSFNIHPEDWALEEKGSNTAYLNIPSFDGTKKEMDSVFNILKQKEYKNLIVDLRANKGGTIEAGMAFANNVFNETTNGGCLFDSKVV